MGGPGLVPPDMTLQPVDPIFLPGVVRKFGRAMFFRSKPRVALLRVRTAAVVVVVVAAMAAVEVEVTEVVNGASSSSSSHKVTAAAAAATMAVNLRITAPITRNTTKTSTSSRPPQLIDSSLS